MHPCRLPLPPYYHHTYNRCACPFIWGGGGVWFLFATMCGMFRPGLPGTHQAVSHPRQAIPDQLRLADRSGLEGRPHPDHTRVPCQGPCALRRVRTSRNSRHTSRNRMGRRGREAPVLEFFFFWYESGQLPGHDVCIYKHGEKDDAFRWSFFDFVFLLYLLLLTRGFSQGQLRWHLARPGFLRQDGWSISSGGRGKGKGISLHLYRASNRGCWIP